MAPKSSCYYSSSTPNLLDQRRVSQASSRTSPPASLRGALSSPNPSRRQSTSSIRSLFTRGTSDNFVSQSPDTASSARRLNTASAKHSRRTSEARAESPHLSRSGSKLDSYRPTQITHATHIDRTRAKQRRAQRQRSTRDPPPLFQALPQAIKHATLDAACLPVDQILKKRRAAKDSGLLDAAREPTTRPFREKRENGVSKHTRKLSASISTYGWTRHSYVLLSSGYLLQYAGHGHHDRQPEKMLNLGKDTVAFASDAIPGRTWVLQVSEAASEDGGANPESSTSIFSRLGMSSVESKRTAQNFLLIFDNAEELDAWLTTIRREVEALGGRPYRPATPPKSEAERDLEYRISQTFRSKRASLQVRSLYIPHQQVLSPVESEFPSSSRGSMDTAFPGFHFWEDGFGLPQSATDSSVLTRTELDTLRGSAESSAGTGANASVYIPSPMSSPTCDTFSRASLPPYEAVDSSSAPPRHTLSAAEADLAPSGPPPSEPQKRQPWGSSDATTKVSTTTRPPNFSVPSFSKRYSSTSSRVPPRRTSIEQTWGSTQAATEQEDGVLALPAESTWPLSVLAPLPNATALSMSPSASQISMRRRSTKKLPPIKVSQYTERGVADIERTDAIPVKDHDTVVDGHSLPMIESASARLLAPLPSPVAEPSTIARARPHQHLLVSSPVSRNFPWAQFPLPIRSRSQRPLTSSKSLRFRTEDGDPSERSYFHRDRPELPSSAKLSANFQAKADSSQFERVANSSASNPRLSRIHETKSVCRLRLPPAGPPPTCPLPEIPSPRRRSFMPKRSPASTRDFCKASPSKHSAV